MVDATLECKRELEIEIPAAEVEQAFTRIAGEYQRKVRIPGFRPGKAPLSLVRQRFQDSIRQEILESLIPAHLRSAFERENLEPVSRPSIDDLHFHAGEPLRFKASFEVMPEIHLADYTSLRLDPVPEPPTPLDEEVEKRLEQIRNQSATYEDLSGDEAVLADGLVAVVSYDRTDEGEQEPRHVAESRIEIGSPDVVNDFSEHLRGARIGDEREFDIHYPADFPHEEIAGKTVHYKLQVKAVQRKQLPALDDEFAKKAGHESLEEYRNALRDRVRHQREHEKDEAEHTQLLDKLVDMHPFPVPDALIEHQIDQRLDRGLRSLAAQGLDPRKLQLDWGQIRSAEREQAARDVKISILLDKIADAEHLEASPEALEAELAGYSERLQQPVDVVRRRLTETGTLDTIKSRLKSSKTLEFLHNSATGKNPQ